MINLIKFEIKKILHKKSFYIITLIFILFAILTNVIYKENSNIYSSSNYTESYDIAGAKENIKILNPNNPSDQYMYGYYKSIIETDDIIKRYPNKTQKYLINEYLRGVIEDKNNALYSNDSKKLTESENLYKEYLAKIDANDWEYFAHLKIAELEELKKIAPDANNKKVTEVMIDIENYRLNNQTGYDPDNYLNRALNEISSSIAEYLNLKTKGTLTNEESETYLYYKEKLQIQKYILEEHQDVDTYNTLRDVIKNFPYEFSLFILIYLIMLSGSIVSEEYSKGTIKYLLTKPYKRSTILASKLLAIAIMLPLIIILMLLLELLIGGIILGFSSLGTPIVIYNSVKDVIISYNVFKYLALLLLSVMPIYLIIGLICFALSTITASTSAAITISFLFYLAANIINNLATNYNFKFFKYFVSLHWDYSYLVNRTTNTFNIEPLTSAIVLILYAGVILCLTFAYFKKKDVKNI